MTPPVLQEILALYPTLPPAERRIADVILGHPFAVMEMTSDALAKRADASQPSTSRFCSRLSTRSFGQFKVRLAQELGAPPVEEHSSVMTLATADDGATSEASRLLEEVAALTRGTLDSASQAVSMLNPESLQNAARVILDAQAVVTCGFDLSSAAAWRLAGVLHLAGIRARTERDLFNAHMWINHLAHGDLIVVVTYRGRLPQLHPALELARSRGVTILVITNEAQSPVIAYADHVLLSHAPSEMSDEDYTSGVALYVQLAVIRALWFAVRIEAERRQAADMG